MAIAKPISTTYRPLLLATAIDGFPFSIFTISPTLSPFAWLQWVSLIAFQTALDPSFYQPVAACLNCLRLILIYDLLTEVNELWPASSVWKTKIVFISRFTHFLHQLAAIRIFFFFVFERQFQVAVIFDPFWWIIKLLRKQTRND